MHCSLLPVLPYHAADIVQQKYHSVVKSISQSSFVSSMRTEQFAQHSFTLCFNAVAQYFFSIFSGVHF